MFLLLPSLIRTPWANSTNGRGMAASCIAHNDLGVAKARRRQASGFLPDRAGRWCAQKKNKRPSHPGKAVCQESLAGILRQAFQVCDLVSAARFAGRLAAAGFAAAIPTAAGAAAIAAAITAAVPATAGILGTAAGFSSAGRGGIAGGLGIAAARFAAGVAHVAASVAAALQETATAAITAAVPTAAGVLGTAAGLSSARGRGIAAARLGGTTARFSTTATAQAVQQTGLGVRGGQQQTCNRQRQNQAFHGRAP